MNSAVANKNRFTAVTAKVKRLLVRQHGSNGIRALSRSLNISLDEGGTTSCSKETFLAALAENGVEVLPEDVSAVWSELDRTGSGSIDPTDFISAICSGLPPTRRTLVERAWRSLRKDPNGSVELRTLYNAFCPDGHPDVVRGDRTARDVLQDLKTTFSEQTNPEGRISCQEFEQYYAAVSALHNEDDSFAALVRGCWPWPGTNPNFTTTLAMRSSAERSFTALQPIQIKRDVVETMKLNQELDSLLSTHRKILVSSKMGFRSVGRLLRIRDSTGSMYIPRHEFEEALWQNRLYIKNPSLLDLLDTNSDGTIDILLYMNMVLRELPPTRRQILTRLWRTFSTDSQDMADIIEIHRRYVAKDGVSLNAFLDAWDRRLVPSGKVSLNEFFEWYAALSDSIALDSLFEQTVRQEWAS